MRAATANCRTPAWLQNPVLSDRYVREDFGIDLAMTQPVPVTITMRMQMARFDSVKNNQRAFASVNDIRRVFREHRAELEWLAYFITGNRAIAQACVTDACTASESRNSMFAEWLMTWARHATIRSAIDTQHERIRQISASYEHAAVVQPRHEPLTEEMLDVLAQHSDVLGSRLDVVSRTALVICGVQKNSIADAALMIGVSRAVASAAYCAAFDCMEAIRCEHVAQESGAALWN